MCLNIRCDVFGKKNLGSKQGPESPLAIFVDNKTPRLTRLVPDSGGYWNYFLSPFHPFTLPINPREMC